MLALGQRFLNEFTRPGITADLMTVGVFPDHDPLSEAPKSLQRIVKFRAVDGTTLHGEFWAQPQPAPTIIISHGFHLSSQYFRAVAALEYAAGMNILLFDYRGHGASAAVATTCGLDEIQDLYAAIELVTAQPETLKRQVYIHGFSMGAAVALLLPPHSAVAGIIADSAYAHLDEMIRLIMSQIITDELAPWPIPNFMRPRLVQGLTFVTLTGGRVLFQLRYRKSLIARPERAIRSQAKRYRRDATLTSPPPILLIHDERDPIIAFSHAERLVIAANAGNRSIRHYYSDSALHCGAYGADPQEYMGLLREFVAESAPTTSNTH